MKKETRVIIFIMIILVFIGIAIAKVYYGNVNKSEDPRVVQAKNLYGTYNALNEQGDFDGMLLLLDSVQGIYEQCEHYRESYEVGVAYNNKAAIFLTLALQESDSIRQQTFFVKSGEYCRESIAIYEAWKTRFGEMGEAEIIEAIKPWFNAQSLGVEEGGGDRIFKKRIKDIQTAQYEIDRRLSVSYANLGIVQRHNNEPIQAAKSYTKAIELWDENLSAKNNLNRLLGKPLEKRSFIKKLFPPKKEKINKNNN